MNENKEQIALRTNMELKLADIFTPFNFEKPAINQLLIMVRLFSELKQHEKVDLKIRERIQDYAFAILKGCVLWNVKFKSSALGISEKEFYTLCESHCDRFPEDEIFFDFINDKMQLNSNQFIGIGEKNGIYFCMKENKEGKLYFTFGRKIEGYVKFANKEFTDLVQCYLFSHAFYIKDENIKKKYIKAQFEYSETRKFWQKLFDDTDEEMTLRRVALIDDWSKRAQSDLGKKWIEAIKGYYSIQIIRIAEKYNTSVSELINTSIYFNGVSKIIDSIHKSAKDYCPVFVHPENNRAVENSINIEKQKIKEKTM